MQYDQFLTLVQRRGRLASRDEAERAIRATLETLGEQLAAAEATRVAAQLPKEIGQYLQQAEPLKESSFNNFFERVAQRESTALPRAVFHARAVIKVLDQALRPSEISRIRAQLPEEFTPLFESSVKINMGDQDNVL